MPNWQEGDVLANGINVHYYRTGGDKPPVVLIHGITDSGLCWTPLAQALEGEYDLIMVDARGHGRSGVPDSGYNSCPVKPMPSGLGYKGLRLASPA